MLKKNCKVIQIESITDVQTLLYADDMANISDTIGELQKQIEQLENLCNLYGMRVNLSKMKIVVFRRGGSLNKDEKFNFPSEQIEVVNCYKYLCGMWITPKLS